jgi:hypothetical protein
VGEAAGLELLLRIAAYGDIAYVDRKLMDGTGVLKPTDQTQDKPTQNGQVTAVEAAWESAVRAHAARRAIPAEQRDQVRSVIARSHIQRALENRLSDTGGGRRGALREVWRAYSTSPALLASTRAVGTSALALLAPRFAISKLTKRR